MTQKNNFLINIYLKFSTVKKKIYLILFVKSAITKSTTIFVNH